MLKVSNVYKNIISSYNSRYFRLALNKIANTIHIYESITGLQNLFAGF